MNDLIIVSLIVFIVLSIFNGVMALHYYAKAKRWEARCTRWFNVVKEKAPEHAYIRFIDKPDFDYYYSKEFSITSEDKVE